MATFKDQRSLYLLYGYILIRKEKYTMANFELTQTGQEVQNILDYAETLQNRSLSVDEDGRVKSANGDLATEKYVDTKVDKVDGKGLSTNDFTNEEKVKLTNMISLPPVTAADNGKILMVVDGEWKAVSLNLSVDANGVLSV